MATGQIFYGVVDGNNIHIVNPNGLVQGSEVMVTVLKKPNKEEWLEGIRATYGSLADIPGLDESLEEILAERKNDTRPEL